MEQQIGKKPDQDEIRLVDLLATVIRHRVWVFWTTGIGTLLAVAILLVLPTVGINLAGENELTLQAAVRVVMIPPTAQASFNVDVAALIQAEASNLKAVSGVYRATLMNDREATLERPAFNRVVRTFIDKALRVATDNRTSTVFVTLKVKESDQQKGVQFLNQFVTEVQTGLKNRTSAQILKVINELEVSGTATSELGAQTRAPYEVAAKALKGVLADADFPMALVGEIEALEDQSGLSRGVLVFICFVGSAFFGILLAFGAEAVSQMRRDPASMDLLRNAWRGE